LNGEANRVSKKQSSAIIAVDVRRFGHVINKDEVFGTHNAFTNFVTGFIEYDYYDFGNRDLTFVQNNGRTFIYGIDETKHVVKAGLNFRFGGYGYRSY
jgi:hypothetical protein